MLHCRVYGDYIGGERPIVERRMPDLKGCNLEMLD
jgi:hypothetical protein